MIVQCTCEKSELTTGAPRRVVLPAPHMAPSVLLKDYQNQVDVVSDVKRTKEITIVQADLEASLGETNSRGEA